ncbi:MAG: hypothetical protein K8S94_02075 [Planctomycetia bacterium]|nr:hypothetical protein [Planctomycetia bacterium]
MLRRKVLAALAAVAFGCLMASPAQAGATAGAVGVKKTANVKIQNVGAIPTYVVIVPQGFAQPLTVADAKRLGAVLLGPSSRAIFYPVPSGNGTIAVIDASLVPQSGPLPPPSDTANYSVGKGRIAYAKIFSPGPTVSIVPKY